MSCEPNFIMISIIVNVLVYEWFTRYFVLLDNHDAQKEDWKLGGEFYFLFLEDLCTMQQGN